MKKLTFLLVIVLAALSLCACLPADEISSADCVRIHIRANSNETADQDVKLTVRDAIINYLTPVLACCETKNEALQAVSAKTETLKGIADKVLAENGFSYRANVTLRREEFPYREYGDAGLPAGVYDALIVELGEASGNNWWCVAFPPLCFVPEADDDNFYYKSKIVEIIKKVRGK